MTTSEKVANLLQLQRWMFLALRTNLVALFPTKCLVSSNNWHTQSHQSSFVSLLRFQRQWWYEPNIVLKRFHKSVSSYLVESSWWKDHQPVYSKYGHANEKKNFWNVYISTFQHRNLLSQMNIWDESLLIHLLHWRIIQAGLAIDLVNHRLMMLGSQTRALHQIQGICTICLKERMLVCCVYFFPSSHLHRWGSCSDKKNCIVIIKPKPIKV